MFIKKFWKDKNLNQPSQYEIVIIDFWNSITILKHYLYQNSN